MDLSEYGAKYVEKESELAGIDGDPVVKINDNLSGVLLNPLDICELTELDYEAVEVYGVLRNDIERSSDLDAERYFGFGLELDSGATLVTSHRPESVPGEQHEHLTPWSMSISLTPVLVIT